ncbi:response regulator transcription factor [Sphingomonas sp. GlSt437]|uniref:response regulator transcription factor n=1 Tax=Sphingomonas sp. GlSt437 TaxID=3389970 RepID=UPI003A8C7B06
MTGQRLLLIEDEVETATLISEVLTGEGYEILWHNRGDAGLRAAAAEPFAGIVLDRMLPDFEGTTIVGRLRAAGVSSPVLMLSALARSENRVEGLDAGADDYLGKPFEPQELIARVRAMLRRATNPVPGAVMIYGSLELHVKSRHAHRAGKHIALSPREFDILKFMMEHAGDVVTRQMLLRAVWNLGFDPQTNVIDVSMSRLRQRLDEGFVTPMIETVRGAGFRLLTGEKP